MLYVVSECISEAINDANFGFMEETSNFSYP